MEIVRYLKRLVPGLLASVLLLFILLTGACSPVEVTQTPEPVTISFTFNLSNDRSNEAKYYEGLAEQFNTQYPHITVDIDPTSRSAILLYSDADVLMLPTWSFRDLKAADALLPLDPLIEMDEDFNHSDFFPGLLRAASDEGQIWGIPAGVDPYVMYYNK
ncbi:MAG: extracellular solute-binding protein, partial [Anaerolineales bacterium]